MITSRVVVKRNQFGELEDFIASFPELVADMSEAVVAKKRAKWIAKLSYTPPRRTYPSDYPLEWTSERQRRAYFATDGFGAGIPYRRTGRMANSWRLYSRILPNRVQVRVENTWKDSAYVVGRISRDNRGTKRKQGFHTVTGWPNAVDTADAIQVEYIKDFNEAFTKFFR